MRPLHFGPGEAPLFGAIHEPAGAARRTGLLVCPPLGTEYLRSYRGLRQLAQIAAQKGFAVMRFDYRGTGDSAGEVAVLSVDAWLADIAMAAQELKDDSGCEQVVLLGLRAGAMLAQEAAAGGLRSAGVIAWDTPPSGRTYVENLRHLEDALYEFKNRYHQRKGRIPPVQPDELLGHQWPEAINARVMLMPGLRTDLKAPLRVFVSRDRTPPEGFESERLPDSGHWSDLDRITAPWIPIPSFQLLAARLAEWLP